MSLTAAGRALLTMMTLGVIFLMEVPLATGAPSSIRPRELL